jgi:outer membrane protein assembly factor BamD
MKKKARHVLHIFALLAISCATVAPESFLKDKELFDHANMLYDRKSYSDSIPFYESLRNRFPQSPYAKESTMKIADAYFEAEDYLEAEISYQTFRSLYPTGDEIPHVVYRLALTHYEQIPGGSGRDQSHTQNAITYFEELKNRWPNSEEAKNSEEKFMKAKRKMIEQELYVVDFYLNQNKYEASLVRLKQLSKNKEFPNVRYEALYKMGYAYYELKNFEEAKESLAKVAAADEAGKYQSKAKSLIAKIQSKTSE